MHHFRFAIVVGALGAAIPGVSPACICGTDQTLEAGLARSSEVFEAQLVSKWPILHTDLSPEAMPALEYDFRVLRSWKGEVPATLTLKADTTNCGYRFEAYESYLIFAEKREPNRGSIVSRCAPTRPIREASAFLATLGAGRRIQEQTEQGSESVLHRVGRLGKAAWLVGWFSVGSKYLSQRSAWLWLGGIVLIPLASATFVGYRLRRAGTPLLHRVLAVSAVFLVIFFSVLPISGLVLLRGDRGVAQWFGYLFS